MKRKSLIPFFTEGDVGGLVYMIANNIVNYIIVIATLRGLEWPDEIIFGRVIPGMSIGLLLGGLYYAYMAWKLSKKLGRADVTALPSGVSTPAMFVILFGVITPLHYAIGDPVVGLPVLAVAMLGVFAGYLFPKKISPFMIAIVGGIIYALCLGRTSFDFWYKDSSGGYILRFSLLNFSFLALLTWFCMCIGR